LLAVRVFPEASLTGLFRLVASFFGKAVSDGQASQTDLDGLDRSVSRYLADMGTIPAISQKPDFVARVYIEGTGPVALLCAGRNGMTTKAQAEHCGKI
jgi:hypothetical protein